MKNFAFWCIIISLFGLLATCFGTGEQRAVWRINLQAHESARRSDWTVVKMSGRFLVIYLDRSGSRLVFDINTRNQVPEEQLAGLPLPPQEEPGLTRFRKASPAVNTIDRWKEMTIEQIGGVGTHNIGDAEYYLREPGKERTSLLRLPCDGNPRFVGNAYILFHGCNGKIFVVNKSGAKIYELSLSYPYIVPNGEGDRFVVYDREESFFHQFEGTDRLRVMVFRSVDGKKLFDREWRSAKEEGTNDGRAALSDDGSLVAIAGAGEVLIFQVPEKR